MRRPKGAISQEILTQGWLLLDGFEAKERSTPRPYTYQTSKCSLHQLLHLVRRLTSVSRGPRALVHHLQPSCLILAPHRLLHPSRTYLALCTSFSPSVHLHSWYVVSSRKHLSAPRANYAPHTPSCVPHNSPPLLTHALRSSCVLHAPSHRTHAPRLALIHLMKSPTASPNLHHPSESIPLSLLTTTRARLCHRQQINPVWAMFDLSGDTAEALLDRHGARC
jgi:hypothetical protein